MVMNVSTTANSHTANYQRVLLFGFHFVSIVIISYIYITIPTTPVPLQYLQQVARIWEMV
jgi:hypothetical protein